MSKDMNTYRVKIKHEVWIQVRAESGAAAGRIAKGMKPRISSPFDPRLGNGDYTVNDFDVIVRAMNLKCESCGGWQHGMKKGDCWGCRYYADQKAEAEGGEL